MTTKCPICNVPVKENYMNEAIKLAEKVGYKRPPGFYEFTFLDHRFWKALGEALGWIGYQCMNCGYKHFSEIGFSECCQYWVSAKTQPQWQYHAHQYLDLILTGGDTEKFWKDLLTP
jgi:hypothetical protein